MEGTNSVSPEKEKEAQSVSNAFQAEIWEVWKKYQNQDTGLNPTEYYRLTTLTLIHAAAVLAVDCGLTDAQFVGMAKKLHDDIKARAPRFS